MIWLTRTYTEGGAFYPVDAAGVLCGVAIVEIADKAISEVERYAKGGEANAFPPQAFLLAFLNSDDRTTLVLAAGLASTVRHAEGSAVGARYDAGSGELPHGRASLITSLS